MPSAAVLTGLAVALFAFLPPSAPAQGTEIVADGVVTDIGADSIGEGGMPASNPRVRSLLAGHPSQFVVICVAGCDGKPTIVQILPRPTTGRAAEYRPSAGTTDKPAYGPAVPGRSAAKVAPDANAVVCVAGCIDGPGAIVQRVVDLPPPSKAAPKPAPTALPKAPEPKVNEPLDIAP